LTVQQQHGNIVHLGVREIQAVSVKVIPKKRMKKKQKWCLIYVQFSTDKKLATTKKHQTLQNSDKKQYSQYWILGLVVFTRFFFFTGKRRVYIGLTSYG